MNNIQTAVREGLEPFRVKPDPMKALRERFLFAVIDEHASRVLSEPELYTLADDRINSLRQHDSIAADALHCAIWGAREQATH